MKVLTFVAFVATVWLANWLVSTYGLVDVGFGLQAPAAVFAVGLAFTLRDALHGLAGPRAVLAAVIVGTAVSMLVAPAWALASGVAFLVSELADMAVFTPLRERSWLGAVVASNTVGLVADSALFLWLAPLPVAGLLLGQCVGKAWMTALAVLVVGAARGTRAVLPRHA